MPPIVGAIALITISIVFALIVARIIYLAGKDKALTELARKPVTVDEFNQQTLTVLRKQCFDQLAEPLWKQKEVK